MSTLLKPIIDILKFNNATLNMCFEGMDNETALKRVIGGCPTSFSYELGHIIMSRFNMVKIAGLNEECSWGEFYDAKNPCNDGEKYPDVLELKETFNDISDKLISTLENMTDKDSEAEVPTAMPMMDKTVRGSLTFLTWHDAYHVGRVGSARTALKMKSVQELFYENAGKN